MEQDRYLIKGHKLYYHWDRLCEFLSKGDTFPIYMEISPCGRCNHRCIFCAYDFIGYPNRFLDYNVLKDRLKEFSDLGLKSILYAGEGEPLLHPNIKEIIAETRKNRIDVGLYTNGQALRRELSKEIIPHLTFIRFSFNAGDPETYKIVHNVKEDTFKKILDNISFAVEERNNLKVKTTIGIQFVAIKENINSLENAVKIFKDIGVDYFVVKPFVHQSPLQKYNKNWDYSDPLFSETFEKIKEYTDESFQVIVRDSDFKPPKRNYLKCYGHNFITAITSSGNVASCLPYWHDENFVYGNIYYQSFYEIWKGSRRKKIKKFLEEEINTLNCPANCRPDKINRFIWEILHPSVEHVNFI